MKFSKGDKVCVLLVSNRWRIDFLCYVGTLNKIEKRDTYSVARIEVTKVIFLDEVKRDKPHEYCVDIRLFKLLHWNPETKAAVKELRAKSRELNQLTLDIRKQ